MDILNRFAYVEQILLLSKIAKKEGLNMNNLIKYIDTTKQYNTCMTNKKRKQLPSEHRCIARTWNSGVGDQCCIKRQSNGLCNRHTKHNPYNTIYSEFTPKMHKIRTKLGLSTDIINNNTNNAVIINDIPLDIDTTSKPPVNTLTLLTAILHNTATDDIDYDAILNTLNKNSPTSISPFIEYITETITKHIESQIEKEWQSDEEQCAL